MGAINDKFVTPVPEWMKEIDEEAYRKISTSHFAEECKTGNTAVIREQMKGLWPFVNAFPQIIKDGVRNLISFKLIYRFGLIGIYELYQESTSRLYQIRRDEIEHRTLWLQTGKVLGLEYPRDFFSEPLKEVKKWTENVGNEKDPFKMFMRFTAIEILAEAISKALLLSGAFRKALGKKGVGWFKAHVHPEDYTKPTHEELALRLGFIFHPNKPTKEECYEIIMDTIDHFLLSAEACRLQAK